MTRDISLGQYYNTGSVIHRLDPRTKLAGTLLFVITLFFPCGWPGLALAGCFLLAVAKLARLSLRMIFKGIRPLWFILFFTAAANMLFSKGRILWAAGPFTISREGIETAAYLVLRLVFLIAGSSVMTFTTTPKEMADGLEKSLGFLKKIRVPIHEFAMMMSIAMHFIPILSEEFERIVRAQKARGADFESGNLIVRGKKLIPLLIPLFVSAIRRSSELALAMDARCYHGGEGRTKLHPLRYGKRDVAAYGVLAVYLAALLLLLLRRFQ